MSLLATIDGLLVDHSGYSSSAVDMGGYETCTFQIPAGSPPRKGATVQVFDGLSTVFYGYVEESGAFHTGGTRGANVTAVGCSGELERNPYAEIYMDRDLNRWTSMSATRKAALAATRAIEDPVLSDDNSGATPGLVFDTTQDIIGTLGVIIEAWYDAGPFCRVRSYQLNFISDAGTTTGAIYAADDDQANGVVTLVSGVTSNIVSVADITPQRYLLAQVTSATAAAAPRRRTLKSVFVMGNHGLARQSLPGLDGIKAIDIIEDALQRSGADFILDNLGGVGGSYSVPHCIYPTPVPPSQVIADMRTLLGWAWGVWEPAQFDNRPIMTIGAPPTEPTCWAYYEDCQEVDLNDKLSSMHDRIIGSSQTVGGQMTAFELERSHPGLPEDVHNTMYVDLGITDTAQDQAAFLLALDQDQSRAAGGLTLPPFVRTANGGIKPSHLLHPGQERIVVQGMPNTGSVISDSNAGRGDTFLVRRISVTEGDDGVIKTTVELDSGFDLTETLNARVNLDHQIAGVGG